MTLLEAVAPRYPEVIALTGAGGKTTTMLQLAREAAASGGRVLVTVTTKIFPPDPAEFGEPIFDPAALAGKRLAVYAGRFDPASGKLQGIDPAAVPSGYDLALVEADGANHKPLKAPGPHEPVIPPSATTVVAVAGLDAIGRPIADMHRPELIAQLAGEDGLVTPRVVAKVLAQPKGRPAGARVLYILNKADDAERLALARAVAALLPGPALITSRGRIVE